MTLWFYILWSLTAFSVFFGPLVKVVSKLLWCLVVALGIWLVAGAITYQGHYSAYVLRQKEVEKKKIAVADERMKLEALLIKHPTSRDILLHLGVLSAEFGEREKMLEYATRLRDVDPNNEKVKTFLHSLR
jgi:hypothetical protein